MSGEVLMTVPHAPLGRFLFVIGPFYECEISKRAKAQSEDVIGTPSFIWWTSRAFSPIAFYKIESTD
jgi:hypothetical protein